MPKIIRESCVLCVCKHIAKSRCQLIAARRIAEARVLVIEARMSDDYIKHYFYALGELSQAEDEMLKDHKRLSILIRTHRKRLEEDHSYDIPFGELIVKVATEGEAETTNMVIGIEKEYQSMSEDELKRSWATMQS